MKEITYSCSLIDKDGTVKAMPEPNSAEMEKLKRGWSARLTDSMSDYYSAHEK